MSFAEAKRAMRAAVHAQFAVSATYADRFTSPPAALAVRYHAKGLASVGDLESAGFAEIAARPDRLLFSRTELDEVGVALRRGGLVTLADYGDEVFILDSEIPADGPETVAWVVTRQAASRGAGQFR